MNTLEAVFLRKSRSFVLLGLGIHLRTLKEQIDLSSSEYNNSFFLRSNKANHTYSGKSQEVKS
jgi:hypothetical protein